MDVSLLNKPLIFEAENLAFQVTKTEDLALICETKDDYHIFIFQTDHELRDNFSNIIISRIVYLDHIIIVNSNEGKYYFSVKNQHAEIIRKMIPENQNYIAEIYGQGLAYNEIKKENTNNPEFLIEQLTSSRTFSLHSKGCGAGGEGSSSCSIDGCSVTCSEGYYACCNHGWPDSCKCIKYALN
jgi:hypothetical protein